MTFIKTSSAASTSNVGKVKVTSSDILEYLGSKLQAGTGISLSTVTDTDGSQHILITSSASPTPISANDGKVKINATSTSDYLREKITAGSYLQVASGSDTLTFSIISPGLIDIAGLTLAATADKTLLSINGTDIINSDVSFYDTAIGTLDANLSAADTTLPTRKVILDYFGSDTGWGIGATYTDPVFWRTENIPCGAMQLLYSSALGTDFVDVTEGADTYTFPNISATISLFHEDVQTALVPFSILPGKRLSTHTASSTATICCFTTTIDPDFIAGEDIYIDVTMQHTERLANEYQTLGILGKFYMYPESTTAIYTWNKEDMFLTQSWSNDDPVGNIVTLTFNATPATGENKVTFFITVSGAGTGIEKLGYPLVLSARVRYKTRFARTHISSIT